MALFLFACLNKSLTLDAPTPTNISTKSEPEIEKNGTPASPATALASNVLPVPGGPTNKTPFGILPPREVYFFGFFKEIYDFHHFYFCFIKTSYISKCDIDFSVLVKKGCFWTLPILNILSAGSTCTTTDTLHDKKPNSDQ
jgi:hypothetical protein